MSDDVQVAPVESDVTETETDSSLLTGENPEESAPEGEGSSEESAPEGEGSSEESAPEGEGGDKSDEPLTVESFTVPEGMELDQDLMNEVVPLFNEAGLNKEQSQKFIDTYASKIQAAEQARLDTFNQLKKEWVDQSKSDKEFGGDGFDENIAAAKNALDKFGTPELTKLMDDFGVGNHPEMIRFMVRVGRQTMEDVPGGGTPQGDGKSAVDVLYPTQS
jgi:hypothetical protein